MNLTIVIPARNEAAALDQLIPEIKQQQPEAEILVVNDGSTDTTEDICRQHGIRLITHPYSMGNGAAIKAGARNANGDVIICMDADGQHDPADISRLLEKMEEGHEMVVGARHISTHASVGRRLANSFYNRLASLMTGHQILDLTSGFRAVRRKHFLRFLYLLPNGFSYPTTSTMAFFRSGLPVAYIPIHAGEREGKSKIRILKDGIRFLVIILKIGALFSPMRLFLPLSLGLFALGSCYYLYTYVNWGRLTNMSAILLLSSLLTFLIGIVSEQISSLHYMHSSENATLPGRDQKASETPD